jgi:hypothetical protein
MEDGDECHQMIPAWHNGPADVRRCIVMDNDRAFCMAIEKVILCGKGCGEDML